jgi:hypothetical protein
VPTFESDLAGCGGEVAAHQGRQLGLLDGGSPGEGGKRAGARGGHRGHGDENASAFHGKPPEVAGGKNSATGIQLRL